MQKNGTPNTSSASDPTLRLLVEIVRTAKRDLRSETAWHREEARRWFENPHLPDGPGVSLAECLAPFRLDTGDVARFLKRHDAEHATA